MAIDVIGRAVPVATDSSQNAASFANRAAPTTPDAVQTELPPVETVQAAPKSLAIPVDDAQSAQARAAALVETAASYVRGKFVYDKQEELVFVSVDERTGDVIQKFPDNAVLRDNSYQRTTGPNQAEKPLIERVA